jgi:tetratricopeptide (TPR) repeat protein
MTGFITRFRAIRFKLKRNNVLTIPSKFSLSGCQPELIIVKNHYICVFKIKIVYKMSKKSVKEQSDAGFEGIEHALTRTERFIEDHQRILSYIVLGIVGVVVLFIGSKRFYFEPKEKDAASELFVAEKFFERDSFAIALNGYGTYPGFLQIMDDYRGTKSANLAKYYAGICYLKLGDFENAIGYLNKFKTNDLLIGAAKYSSLGDAYSEQEQFEQAADHYLTGAEKYPNNYSTPVLLKKAGIVYEQLKDYNRSLEIFTRIKKEYPTTTEGLEMDRYIARAKEELNK